jgi:hypothetical protein
VCLRKAADLVVCEGRRFARGDDIHLADVLLAFGKNNPDCAGRLKGAFQRSYAGQSVPIVGSKKYQIGAPDDPVVHNGRHDGDKISLKGGIVHRAPRCADPALRRVYRGGSDESNHAQVRADF